MAGIGGGAAPTDGPADEATIVSLEGRMYPVEVAYLKEPTEDYVSEAVRVAWGLHMQASTISSIRPNVTLIKILFAAWSG